MPATLVNSRLFSLEGETAINGNRVTAVWYVTVSEATTAQRVIVLAQGADDNDDDNRPVPNPHDFFKTHLDGQTTPDNALVCTRIRAMQRRPGPDHRTKWKVTATYENPTAAGENGAGRDLDLHPLERKARFRSEQFVITESRDSGANKEQITYSFLDNRPDTAEVDNSDFRGRPRIRYADAFSPFTGPNGPVTDASGRRVFDVPTFQRLLPVFVMKANTLNPFSWISLVEDFTDADGRPNVNASAWKVFGQEPEVAPRRCMFLSAEVGDPLYWGQIIYYELTVKVLYDRLGHDIRVRNEGVDFWRKLDEEDLAALRKRPQHVEGSVLFERDTTFASGLPVPPPIALNLDGTLRSDQTGDVDILTFRDLAGRSFEELTTRVANGG